MAHRYYQRPENAISKAEEFINVGKPTRALDTLYDVIKSKKRHHNYSEKLIEQIMFKYLELCVDLKKSHVAKEGLFQYRNMSQSTNVASLASVVQGYLNMAEKRTDAARQESQDNVQQDGVLDDLENLSTPEMIMLSAVSGEDAQDRSDRTILMPWVKFLWESYCQCLELLRTNLRVERLYHDIAQQAFRFCLKYQRKTEFRKLCDKLRNHLEMVLKQTPSPTTINLNNAETQQMNLDTRLVMLDAAIQMELWQEAYKAVEDIHGLMSMSKKVFPPKMMANYYQKLALVFWKSGNYLFHAAAIFKHFQLTREMKKNLSSEELAKMASRVLVACLAVPIPSQHPEFDKFIETDRTPQEKMVRLALLLGLQQPPTRQSLLKDAQRFGVVQATTKQVQDLFQWMEVDFHPLKLCRRIEQSIAHIQEAEELSALLQYIPALKEVTLVRLLKQVAQVYQSICFKRLLELAPFTDAFALERVIVDCVRHNDMQIRIDHRSRNIHFGTDLAEAQSHDLAEGPHLQDMPSEQIRTQLMTMLEVMDKSLKTIHPDKVKIENNSLRLKIVDAYHQSKARDHQRILERHKFIEERKEYLEKMSIHREAEEQRKVEQQKMEQQKLEDERLAKEREERAKKLEEDKIKQIQQNHLTEKLQQIAQTDLGKKILDKMDEKEIAELDADQIMAKQVEELEKEKRELLQRLKAQEKKVDHMERAKRKEEIPLLTKAFETDRVEDAELWKIQEEERIKKAEADRKVAVEVRKRLLRIKEDKESYHADLLKQRKTAFEKKLKDFNAKLDKERAIRMAERKQAREDERREKWVRQKEEEAQRKRDEQLKKEREQREKEEAERKAKEEEEYRKNKERLDAAAAKQREREKEIEERMQKDREEARKAREEARDARGGGREDQSDWRREREDRDRDDRRDRDGRDDRRDRDGRDDRGDRGMWRRDDRPPPRDRDDRDRDGRGERGERGERGAWKPGGGSWRDREQRKDDEWRGDKPEEEDRDRRGPPMRRGGDEDDRDRRGPPMRRGGDDDRRPPPRRMDDDQSDWRRDRGPPSDRDDRDRRGPPREDDRDRRGPPPRDREDDDRRGPMRRNFGGDRDRDRDGDRGGFGGRGGQDAPGDWRRRDDRDRDGPPRRDDRDRDGPPRRDFQRRDDDRDRDGGGAWRRRDDRDDRGPRREDGPPPRRDDGPPPRRDGPPQEGDEGWTTVSKR